MKLVICCNQSKPYLVQGVAKPMHTLNANNPFNFNWKLVNKGFSNDRLNGEVVFECDFEVEELEMVDVYDEYDYDCYYQTYKTPLHQILKSACLTFSELCNCLKYNDGYAIHIKNLHIFDKPIELSDYSKIIETPYGEEPDKDIKKPPKTMIPCCYLENDIWKKAFMVSRPPQELYNILNGKQTTIILKRIPNEIKTKI